ncbi:MAG: 3-deoxy-7-phosphoheptulonate synthase [bacterium]|nr:3-deoxy-7-phosphoheptulonate synthase [bacterium]
MSLPEINSRERFKPILFTNDASNESYYRISLGNLQFGGDEIVLIAGPCAVESEEQILLSATLAKEVGVKMLRGGIFKPRTSPYSFQGLGMPALEWFRKAADKVSLPIVSEVMDVEQVDQFEPYVDVLQIGSRNMQNFSLLKRVGQSHRPILLKRGMSATYWELINAAMYIAEEGNTQIILCERGIRTFSDFTRNTFDVAIIPKLKQECKLPVIADPSHASGDSKLVIPLALSAIAAGADGIMVEFHPNPQQAKSDAKQALSPEQLKTLALQLRSLAVAMGRRFGE